MEDKEKIVEENRVKSMDNIVVGAGYSIFRKGSWGLRFEVTRKNEKRFNIRTEMGMTDSYSLEELSKEGIILIPRYYPINFRTS